MGLYYCPQCKGTTILQDYWNGIPNLHCLTCGTSEEDSLGIYSKKTKQRVWSRPHDSGIYRAKLKNEPK